MVFVGSYSGKWTIYNMYKDKNGFFSPYLGMYYDSKEELLNNLKDYDESIFIAQRKARKGFFHKYFIFEAGAICGGIMNYKILDLIKMNLCYYLIVERNSERKERTMAIPSFKTLQTLDLAIIRFGENVFTRDEFNAFITEARNAGLDVCAFSTLTRFKLIEGEYVQVLTNSYTPDDFVRYVNTLIGDDLYGMSVKYEYDVETQRFYEYTQVYQYHIAH